jgi:hypothetical protein
MKRELQHELYEQLRGSVRIVSSDVTGKILLTVNDSHVGLVLNHRSTDRSDGDLQQPAATIQ